MSITIIDVWVVTFVGAKYDEDIKGVYRTREAAYQNENSDYCSVGRRKAIVDEFNKVYLIDENHSESFELNS